MLPGVGAGPVGLDPDPGELPLGQTTRPELDQPDGESTHTTRGRSAKVIATACATLNRP